MKGVCKLAVAICAAVLVTGCASHHRTSGTTSYSGHKASAAKHMSDCDGLVKMRGGKVYMAHPVFFGFDQWNVSSKYTGMLSCIAMATQKIPVQIVLTGYTDNVGSSAYNMQLGRWRANAVKNYLVKKGANPHYIYPYSVGEMMPMRVNDSAQNRAYNRRVDFKFDPLFPAQNSQ